MPRPWGTKKGRLKNKKEEEKKNKFNLRALYKGYRFWKSVRMAFHSLVSVPGLLAFWMAARVGRL